jgi:hypothetical protein
LISVDSSPVREPPARARWSPVVLAVQQARQAVDPCAWEKKKKQEETGAACLRFCPEKKAVGLFAS